MIARRHCTAAVFFLAGASLIGCGRSSRGVVAVVNGTPITLEEFEKRYNEYRETTSQKDNILVREGILDHMINERLIFEDLGRRGWDADSVYRAKMDEITGQALLDAYARRVGMDTVTVTESELESEFRAAHSKVNARYLYADTEAGARALKARLERGETFAALARTVFRDPGLAANGGSLGYFGTGEMEPALEAAAFALAPGALSDPVKLRIGYAIIRVDKRVMTPLLSEIDFAKEKPALERAIRERKARSFVRRLDDQIARDLETRFNDDAVGLLFERWGRMHDAGAPDDVESAPAETFTRPERALTLATFRGFSWTVDDFLRKSVHTPEKHLRRVRTADDVKEVVVGLATRDQLLERAKTDGLERDDRVRDQVARVRNDYLLRRWGNAVHDSVARGGWDEHLMRAFYDSNKTQYAYPPLVNAAEILVRTRGEADSLLRLLRRGASFVTLARANTIRTGVAEAGGELGFAPQSSFGRLGPAVFAARKGGLIGPERIEPGYCILKVLDRKEGRLRRFEECRDDIIRDLLPSRKGKAFIDAVAALRARSAVTINKETLGNAVTQPN